MATDEHMGSPEPGPEVDGAGVSTTRVRTCESRNPYWRQCSLLADHDHTSLCILHDPNKDKDAARFNQTLQEKIEREEADPDIKEVDLSRVVFPAGTTFRGKVFQKNISFNSATFGEEADFYTATFSGDASFHSATFSGGAYFASATFSGLADFSMATFCVEADFASATISGSAYFTSATFSGSAYFYSATFGEEADFYTATFSGDAYFNSATFSGGAHFSRTVVKESLIFQGPTFPDTASNAVARFDDVTGENPQKVRFEGVDLSRVSFLRTDVSQIRFVGCTWAEKRPPLLWPIPFPRPSQGRTVIYDEVAFDLPLESEQVERDRRLVADLYRQLRLNFESNRQETEAGDFYIGQMEMRRRDKSYPAVYRFILGLYRVLATYGESYGRPAFFYLVGGLFFAVLYLWAGFQVSGGTQVQYSPLTLGLGNPGPFFKDFVPAYIQALSAGGILGTNLAGLSGINLASGAGWVPLVRYANMLLDTFLVGFFVIALRRHFRR